MSTYIPKIKKNNDKPSSREYCIVETEKVFELSYDEIFWFDEEKFINSVKEKYFKSKFYITVDTMNLKLRSKGLFDSKRDNWFNLRNNTSFKLTINEVINGFKLKEYDKNHFNEISTDISVIKSKRSRSRFGFGDANEGVFFTYDSFFCLLNSGDVKDGSLLQFGNPKNTFKGFDFKNNEISSFFQDIISIGLSQYIDWENSTIDRLKSSEIDLSELKNKIITQFDKDSNGLIDVIEDKNEFVKLLTNHQNLVIEKSKEFNQNYTHQFIKVGNYLNDKKKNLQLIFDYIKNVEKVSDFNEYVDILENDIHSYNLLLFNSLNLIVSLIEDDQLTFYDIYEKFDKMNIFNSNWEIEISQKLTTLNSNIKGLMHEIRDMGNKITNSIEDLSYVTEESTRLLDNRLGDIDSSIKTNNLLTLINTYQTYKINKNTKRLQG